MQALLITAALLSAPQDSETLTERFEAPEGVVVSLWAESPHLYNPAAIDVDPKGRVWVAEAVNYRRWGGRNPGVDHPEGDRIVIVEDTDGDGSADSSKVFVQDADLTAPLGICVVPPHVYVSCSPNIFVYTDEDGDDVPDKRETFLTGFGGFDHDHGVHSVVAGDDGWLYIAAGNAGPHIVTGSDGATVRSGSIYTGGSPYNGRNSPGLVSDDGMDWTAGIMLRVRPDGTGLHVFADNFRNQYEIARDSYGNLYTEDNDDDGNRGCRTAWVAEGARYGYYSADGSRTWRADMRPGQEVQAAHWHAEDPGVMPTWTINGAGGPTGVCVYESGPIAGLEGAVLNCDAGVGVVYAHMPVVDGSAYRLEPSVFLGRTDASGRAADDGKGNWFRPSDVCVSTDGAVYVADWYDPGVGGHAARDRESYGRILRVEPEAHTGEVREGLRSPCLSVRAVERARLIAMGPDAEPIVNELWQDSDPRVVARAMQLAIQHSTGGRAAFVNHDFDWTPELQITALRTLWLHEPSVIEPIWREIASDASPLVRSTFARLLGELDWETRAEALFTIALHHEAGDRVSVESIGIGARGHEGELATLLAEALAVEGLEEDVYRDLLWRLHPVEAVEPMLAYAMDERLSLDARAQMIDGIAFCDAREAADAMFVLWHAGPGDTRESARWWFNNRIENHWREYAPPGARPDANLGAATQRFSSGVIKAGLTDVDVDVTGGERLWLVVTDGGDGDACDWADWIDPRFVLKDGGIAPVRTWDAAEQGWGMTRLDKSAGNGPLRVGDEAFERGIGTHANAQILLPVPTGARRFLASVGPDYGGTSQGCGSTVAFEVWVEDADAESEVDPRRMTLMNAAADWVERERAAKDLASDPEGGLFLLARAEESALPARLVTAATEAIYKNPDLGVRALATAHFPRPGMEALPPVAELLALEGSAERGREVFRSERARCSSCHAHTGFGQDIGPDLTAIHSKYGRGELLDAVLNPSAAITHGYDTYLVQTTDGTLASGFVLADGVDLILKDTQGNRHVIPSEDIAVKKKQELSVMPEGLTMGLGPQEIADLLAFLERPDEREPEFGEPIELFNGVDLTGWTHHLRGGGERDDVWSIADGVIRCEGNPVGYIRTEADYENYELTLEWRFDPDRGAGNSGVLCRMTGEDTVWPHSMEAQLQSGSAGDIWNIDKVPMVAAPERTSGRHTRGKLPSSERPLGEWNSYRIRCDRGYLRLEVNGAVQNEAIWCEEVPGKICLQSEGAYIEFRNIVLTPIVN